MRYIPISALKGDNVVNRSENMEWYDGPTLLYTLETVHVGSDFNHIDSRFPVQYVVRPQSDAHHDFRGYAGRIAGGVFKPGDEVTILPSGYTSTIKALHSYNERLEEAFAPMSVVMTLTDDIDISRGDMIAKPTNLPRQSQDLEVMVCWMNEKPLQPRGKYKIMHTTRTARCIVKDVRYKVNVNTLHRVENDNVLGLNDIGRIVLRTTIPLLHDDYRRNRATGSIILIDEFTNETVAAGMIL